MKLKGKFQPIQQIHQRANLYFWDKIIFLLEANFSENITTFVKMGKLKKNYARSLCSVPDRSLK